VLLCGGIRWFIAAWTWSGVILDSKSSRCRTFKFTSTNPDNRKILPPKCSITWGVKNKSWLSQTLWESSNRQTIIHERNSVTLITFQSNHSPKTGCRIYLKEGPQPSPSSGQWEAPVHVTTGGVPNLLNHCALWVTCMVCMYNLQMWPLAAEHNLVGCELETKALNCRRSNLSVPLPFPHPHPHLVCDGMERNAELGLIDYY
jgi:hypothetical protein